MTLEEAMAKPRVAIAGVPDGGKTTLADKHAGGRPVIRTDDSIGKAPWSERSADLVRQCAALDSFVVEGMRVPHALRKGLKVDAVVWLGKAHEKPDPGKLAMGKGAKTVFDGWRAADSGRTPVVVVS